MAKPRIGSVVSKHTDYATIQITSLRHGDFQAIIDLEDMERTKELTWGVRLTKTSNGNIAYAYARNLRNKHISLHRFILGELADGLHVDHKNRDPMDNRRANLRVVNRSQNMQNRSKGAGKTSKFKGVHFRKDNGFWRASIRVGPKLISLGQFNSESEAAIAYNEAAKEHFGAFAALNEF